MTETLEDHSFDDFIQSHLFTFYIGVEKKPFVVHSGAVTASSGHFRALVNGDMTESLTRSAELNDVEPADFSRYLEFIYRHDYTVPSWKLDEKSAGISRVTFDAVPQQTNDIQIPELQREVPIVTPVESVLQQKGIPQGTYTSLRKSKGRKSSLGLLRTRVTFEQRNYLPKGDPKSAMLQNFEPRSNSNVQQDYTPIFLAHARLYTFAGMRLVDSLKNLALHKLHRTLLDFQLYNQRVGDVIALARYAYDNGADRGANGKLDELRELVVEYMAGEMTTLGKHSDFVKLLEEGGEFVGDFWNLVC